MKFSAVWIILAVLSAGCSHLIPEEETGAVLLNMIPEPGMSTLLIRELEVTAADTTGRLYSSRYGGIPESPLVLELPAGRWHISARGYAADAQTADAVPLFIEAAPGAAVQGEVTFTPLSGYGEVVLKGEPSMQALLLTLDGRLVRQFHHGDTLQVYSGAYLLFTAGAGHEQFSPVLVLPGGSSSYLLTPEGSLKAQRIPYIELSAALAGSGQEVPLGCPVSFTAVSLLPDDPLIAPVYLWYVNHQPFLTTSEPTLTYWPYDRAGPVDIQVVVLGIDAADQVLCIGSAQGRILVTQD